MKFQYLYEFGVFVDGRQVREYPHNLKTYIEGRRGSNYELYFRNNSDNRVEVIFSVDGLGVIDGKSASSESKGYLVNACDQIKVPGWTLSNSGVAKFEFRPQGDRVNSSYVEELKREGFDVDAGNQGFIGCMVISEKKPLYIPYNGTPANMYHKVNTRMDRWQDLYPIHLNSGLNTGMVRGHASGLNQASVSQNYMQLSGSGQATFNMTETSASLGTGFGEKVTYNTTEVSFEKDQIIWTPVINYDTLSNLKKKGIIVEENDFNKAFPSEKKYCYVPKSKRGT